MEVALNFKDIIIGVNGILILAVGYFLKEAMDELKTHRDKLSNLHETYVKKDDFKDFKEELWARLDDLKQQVKGDGR